MGLGGRVAAFTRGSTSFASPFVHDRLRHAGGNGSHGHPLACA